MPNSWNRPLPTFLSEYPDNLMDVVGIHEPVDGGELRDADRIRTDALNVLQTGLKPAAGLRSSFNWFKSLLITRSPPKDNFSASKRLRCLRLDRQRILPLISSAP